MVKSTYLSKKKYKLLLNTIIVEFYKEVTNDDGGWIFGETEFNASVFTIRISTFDKDGHPLPEDVIETTLRHELFHAILKSLYIPVGDDETVVEWLANATQMLNKQGLTI
jgi:hypothetical protein